MRLIERVRGAGRAGMAVAIVALVVGAAGSAVAAKLITGKDVKNNSLTGADVRNRSLTKLDFRGSVKGPRGARGPTGATGAIGATGTTGDDGVAGATNVVIRTGSATNFGGSTPAVATATCLPGERATGGGVNVAGEPDNAPVGAAQIIESYPTPVTAAATPTGWAVAMTRAGSGTDTATAYVICASP